VFATRSLQSFLFQVDQLDPGYCSGFDPDSPDSRQVAEEYVRTSMSRQDMRVLDCYITYYVATFYHDDLRKALADRPEKRLGLA
jgi:hypothetical protein